MVCSLILFASLMSPTIWSGVHERKMIRMQRSLRFYLVRAA